MVTHGAPGAGNTFMVRTLFMIVLIVVSAPVALQADAQPGQGETSIRVATYNIKELSRDKLDTIDEHGHGTHPQLLKAAEVIQRVRPDILLINEIDFDEDKRDNARLFQERYLRVSQDGRAPIGYDHIVFEPVNTGIRAGRDFNNDGRMDGPDDAYGFGRYPGQYGMALYSRFPIERDHVRTFRLLLWKDMPGHLMPDGRDGRPAWYDDDERAVFRLSSKSHWDVPARIAGRTLHLLAAHPTPPVFDGPEDRNGRRNFDEIRLWADYITGGPRARYIRDDQGRAGPLPEDAAFIILGDLNADPAKDPAPYGQRPIDQLLQHSRIQDPQPRRRADAAIRPATRPAPDPSPCDAGIPACNRGAGIPVCTSTMPTSDFGRLDYVLPARTFTVRDAGIYHPPEDHPDHHLTNASDHLLVWLDIEAATHRNPRAPGKRGDDE
jgi:3-phytase